MPTVSLGHHAYHAYGARLRWVTEDHEPMVPWKLLPPRVRSAWQHAANAALHASAEQSWRRTLDEDQGH
jgi:hypothetical protein